MVSITTTGSSIIFTFEDCPTYLQNGTIELPKNSLSLTVDGSGMATYRKAQSNDIFVSVSLDELGMTEQEIIEEFADMVSTGGGEEEQIQELSGKVSTLSGTVTSHTSNSDIHVTSQDKSAWDAKASTSDIEAAVSGKADSSAVTEEIAAAVSGKADSSAVTNEITAAVSGKQDTLVSGTNIKTINNTSLLGEGNITIEGGGTVTIDPDLDPDSPNPVANSALTAIITGISGNVETISGSVTAHTSDSTIHVTSQDKTNWDGKASTSDIEAAVSGKADSSAVTEEIAAAVSGKADSSAVTEQISAAVSGKQDTLVSGTNIKTINNTSILGSGNITIEDRFTEDVELTISTALNDLYDNKADTSALTSHTSDTTIHVTSQDKTVWNAKADASDLSTLSGTVTGLSSDVSTLSGTVTGISSDVSTLSGTVTGISSDVSTLSGTVTGISSDVSTLSGTVTSHTADTTVHVTSTDKTNWDGAVTALGGVKLVKITQSAYDQLGTKDPDTLYIITAS